MFSAEMLKVVFFNCGMTSLGAAFVGQFTPNDFGLNMGIHFHAFLLWNKILGKLYNNLSRGHLK